MTPKEKARELVDKMYLKIPSVYDPTNLPHYPIAKEMSLIAVDEIDRVLQSASTKEDPYVNLLSLEYWQEVKHEIELL